MIEPPLPCAIIARIAARVVRKAPSTWMAIRRCQSASLKSTIGLMIWMPALEISTSTPPNCSTTLATPASTCASLTTFISTAIAWPPPALISSAVACAAVSTRSAITTFAPAFEYSSAISLPMPLAAPVMMATLSLSVMCCSLCDARCAMFDA